MRLKANTVPAAGRRIPQLWFHRFCFCARDPELKRQNPNTPRKPKEATPPDLCPSGGPCAAILDPGPQLQSADCVIIPHDKPTGKGNVHQQPRLSSEHKYSYEKTCFQSAFWLKVASECLIQRRVSALDKGNSGSHASDQSFSSDFSFRSRYFY